MNITSSQLVNLKLEFNSPHMTLDYLMTLTMSKLSGTKEDNNKPKQKNDGHENIITIPQNSMNMWCMQFKLV